MFFIVGNEKPKHLVLVLSRKHARAFHDIVCFCRRARKDGTCQLTEGVALNIDPAKRHRVRIVHEKLNLRSEPLSRIARLQGRLAAQFEDGRIREVVPPEAVAA